jgi:hypothetical protein
MAGSGPNAGRADQNLKIPGPGPPPRGRRFPLPGGRLGLGIGKRGFPVSLKFPILGGPNRETPGPGSLTVQVPGKIVNQALTRPAEGSRTALIKWELGAGVSGSNLNSRLRLVAIGSGGADSEPGAGPVFQGYCQIPRTPAP